MRKVARYLIMIGAGFAVLMIGITVLYLIITQLAYLNGTILKQFSEGRMGSIFYKSLAGTPEEVLKKAKFISLILGIVFDSLVPLYIWTFMVAYSTMNNLASKKHMILNIIVGLTGNIFCLAGGICGLIGMKQGKAEEQPEVKEEIEQEGE